MSDVAAFAAVLSSLKTAVDIAKTLKSSELSIERAEMKLKLAELLEALADAKISAVDLQEIVAHKEKEIVRLLDALSLKEDVVRRYDAYYKKGPKGSPTGDPFCLRCWELEKKLFHLARDNKANGHRCPVCSTVYDFLHTQSALSGDENG